MAEAGKLLHISPATMTRLMSSENHPSFIQIGNRKAFTILALQHWVLNQYPELFPTGQDTDQ